MKYFKLSRFFGTVFGVLSLLDTSFVLGMDPYKFKKYLDGLPDNIDVGEFYIDSALKINTNKLFEEHQKSVDRSRAVSAIVEFLKKNEESIEIRVSKDYGEFDGVVFEDYGQYSEVVSKSVSKEGVGKKICRHDVRGFTAKKWQQKLAEMLYDAGLDSSDKVNEKLKRNDLIFKISKNGKCEFEFIKLYFTYL